MFRRLEEGRGDGDGAVAMTVDGRPLSARAEDSVASALLAAGALAFRCSPVSGRPRAPYCMMGVCFECLVTIDGQEGRRACMTPVRVGMEVQTGAQGAGND